MKTPPVLIFSATDGTCGAGLAADCRAVSAAGGIPLAAATGITAQNLDGVRDFFPATSAQVRAQFLALRGVKFAACKIGVCGVSAAAIAEMLETLPRKIPVVWDPVLAPTGGAPFANEKRKREMLRRLLPRADIITPNSREFAALSGAGGESEKSVREGVFRLLDGGAKMVLITGLGADTKMRHELYGQNARLLWRTEYRRRRGEYHGGGCLFSSATATRLARGDAPESAAAYAHSFVARAMNAAIRLPALGAQLLPLPSPEK